MSSRGAADEIRYCERCGISWLWSVEEQRRREEDERAPELCPGCRALLPSGNRERGMVKWYNIRKRYGFIVRAHEPELFVPASALRGTRFLQSGDLVEFSLGANDEGPIADEVRVVGAGTT